MATFHRFRPLSARAPRRLVVALLSLLIALPATGEASAAPSGGGGSEINAAPTRPTPLAQVRRCRARRGAAARRACARRATVRRERPVRGGTLVAALSADPGQLNPAITTSGAVHPAAEPMFNGLVSNDEDGDPVPELARGWRVERGGARYTFFLRRGVRWHDGRPFTSADVKYTYDEVLLKFHARTRASMLPALERIDAPNPLTVVFNFRAPYAPLLQQLDVTEGPILPKHIYEGTDPLTNPRNTSPVGTGPYRFVRYESGSEVVLERNRRYFRSALPYLDRMVMRIIPDESTRMLALEAGEVDWIPNLPVPALDRARLNQNLSLVRTPWNPGGANCIMTVSFNLDRPMFQDVRFRRAFGHALDREQFLDQVLFGEGRVATAPISSGIGWAHGRNLLVPGFDPGLAAALFDEAGWKQEGPGPRVARGVAGVPDGTRLVFEWLQRPTDAKYGEIVRQRLGDVGAQVNLRTLQDVVFQPTIFRDRAFDTNIISYCNATDPQVGVRRMYHSSQIGPTSFTNSSAYRNDEVDALFDEAARTLDRRAAGAVYQRLQEVIVADLPYMWLVETEATRGHTPACRGFRYRSGLFAEAAWCRR